MKVFTIGYGGRRMDEFLGLLGGAGVKTVVDVRLRPDRAHSGEWTKAKTPDKGIEKRLSDAGMGYVSLVELGNPFMDLADWPARYERLLEGAGELLVSRLAEVVGPYCLLCAEKRAEDCHRRLIGAYLARTKGTEVVHL